MKKLIVLAVVIAVIAAAPWYVGMQAQKEIEAQVAKMTSYPGYKVEITEYNRGLLSSSAKINAAYEFKQPANAGDTEKEMFAAFNEGLAFNLAITHGPLLTKPALGLGMSYTEVTFDDSVSHIKKVEELFGVEEVFTAKVFMDLGGEGNGTISVPALSYSEENQNFDFGGLNIDLVLSDFGKRVSASGGSEKTSVNADNQLIEISPISIKSEAQQIEGSLYGIGDFHLVLPEVKVSGEQSGTLKDFEISGGISIPEPGLMDIDYNISASSLSSSAFPETLSDTQLHLSLKRLKESTLNKITELGAQADMTDPVVMAEQQKKMQELFSELLANSPEIDINNFKFKFGEEAWMNLKGKLSVNGELAAQAQNNPLALIPAITADYTANVSEALIELGVQQYMSQQLAMSGMSGEEMQTMLANQEQQTSMMIGQFVAMGFLKKTEKGYQVQANFKDGALTVNGAPVPLPF